MTRPATAEQSWTIGRLLEWTISFLKDKGAEFPRLDAEVLLAQAQGCRRIELYTRFEETATDDVRTKYRELIRKRVEGCPVAYLVGRKEFFSLELEVTPAVLIPRPATETLVTAALEIARTLPEPRILDVGTGSGNIAIALAKQLPKAELAAIDRSADALTVAQRNATKHGVAERIRFLEGDLLAPLSAGEQFDLIVSNPPYIATEDWDKLEVGVRQYEPKLALDGGRGGYQVIERLVTAAGPHLRPGGYMLIEIGAPQENVVRGLLERQGGYELAPTIRDYSGHPRVVKGKLKVGS